MSTILLSLKSQHMQLITERTKRDRDRCHRGLRDRRETGSRIGAARDRGIVADHGRICPQLPIGFVNPLDHRSTFSDIQSGRLVNCQEFPFSRLAPIEE
jgi:hypothetical protein